MRTEQGETIVRGDARGLAELRNRIRQLLIYLLFVAHVICAVLKSRLQYIPDESIWHIASICKHQSRSIAMKTCIISVYIKTRHYLQLKTLFHGNVEADILCGRTVFSHYPRLYLKGDPRRLRSIPAFNMPKQANPRAARLNTPVVSKPSIAYKISSIFTCNRASLCTVFVFP